MSYTFSRSGKNVCNRCGKTGVLLEGTAKYLEETIPSYCTLAKPCGYAGPQVLTNDEDPAFIALWTSLTGTAPKDVEDWY